jgi:hypothetical protein
MADLFLGFTEDLVTPAFPNGLTLDFFARLALGGIVAI